MIWLVLVKYNTEVVSIGLLHIFVVCIAYYRVAFFLGNDKTTLMHPFLAFLVAHERIRTKTAAADTATPELRIEQFFSCQCSCS